MVTRLRRALFLVLVLAAVVLAACGEDSADGDLVEEGPAAAVGEDDEVAAAPTPTPMPTPTPTATPEAAMQVTAAVAPVADLVARIGGERVRVETLVPPGADSHTYEPRPGDVARLADSDAYVGIGLDLNPAAVRLAEEHLAEGSPVVLLGERLDERGLLAQPDVGHTHDHDHGHTHDDEPDHTHDGPNPHVWTSVNLVMEMVDHVAEALAELDPEGADAYRENAQNYLLDLRELDEAIAAAVTTVPERNRTLLAYHDAWVYFADDYDLESVTAVQPADFSEPSAAEVRAIIDLVRDEDVPAVFGSEVFPSDVLDAIADETGAAYVGDLSDDALPGDPGSSEHTYWELMRRNGVLIVEGLGGDASPLEALRPR